MVLEQAAKHGFYRALTLPTHALTLSTLLTGQRPAIIGRVGRSNELSLLGVWRAGRLVGIGATIRLEARSFWSKLPSEFLSKPLKGNDLLAGQV